MIKTFITYILTKIKYILNDIQSFKLNQKKLIKKQYVYIKILSNFTFIIKL